ncbi:MAG: hypothetical protein JSR90_02970 [Proteobacteria bacterium]|nr:hypothetical protein [Pseudomonadota bacterium]
MSAVGAIAGKLERFPLEEIGSNLNGTLASLNAIASGPDVRGVAKSLSGSLADLQELTHKANTGLSPLFQRLPDIAANLDRTVSRVNATAHSIESGYGADSPMNRQLDRALQQMSDAARAVRALADMLERHPEALLRGRSQ